MWGMGVGMGQSSPVAVVSSGSEITLPETNSKFAPENKPSLKETIVFQPSIFRGELLVSRSVMITR